MSSISMRFGDRRVAGLQALTRVGFVDFGRRRDNIEDFERVVVRRGV